MAKRWICPYWVCEARTRSDVNITDHQTTEFHITNPGDREGRLELMFYEARGDGNFYPSEWASGVWAAPAKWQRVYRPDPSSVFGSSFLTYGWMEAWTDVDDLVMDVRIAAINRSTTVPGAEGISQRTIPLIEKPIPILARIFGTFFRNRQTPYLPIPAGSQGMLRI